MTLYNYRYPREKCNILKEEEKRVVVVFKNSTLKKYWITSHLEYSFFTTPEEAIGHFFRDMVVKMKNPTWINFMYGEILVNQYPRINKSEVNAVKKRLSEDFQKNGYNIMINQRALIEVATRNVSKVKLEIQ